MFLVFVFLQTGEKSGQVEKSKKNARQRQNDFKVCFIVTVYTKMLFWESCSPHLFLKYMPPKPVVCTYADCFIENDRGDDPSAGEARSGGSSAHHPATGGAESLRRLGEQDRAHWSLAYTNHPHRQVLTPIVWICDSLIMCGSDMVICRTF